MMGDNTPDNHTATKFTNGVPRCPICDDAGYIIIVDDKWQCFHCKITIDTTAYVGSQDDLLNRYPGKRLETKVCSQCQKELPFKLFLIERNGEPSQMAYCNECYNFMQFIGEKRCNQCGIVQSLDNFAEYQSSIDGHRHTCNTCKPTKSMTKNTNDTKTDGRYILKQHMTRITKRPTYWYDHDTGQIVLPDGTPDKTSEPLKLVPLMNFIESLTKANYEGTSEVSLFVKAGTINNYKPDRYWFHIGCDWQELDFHYDNLGGSYERNGFKVWMQGTSIWFGDEQDIAAMRDAYYQLENNIGRYFRYPHYTILSTPAATGRGLLEFSLPDGEEYETLPRDLQELISKNFGQSRDEYMYIRDEYVESKREILEDGIYVLDGSYMYASCLSHLPVGMYIHDTKDEIELNPTKYGFSMPKYPGLYRVTFTVPEWWSHIGLLKAPPRHKHDKSYYPNTPGQTFTNWVTGNELALAKSEGWHVVIHERIIWPDTEKHPDVFEKWRNTLIFLRNDAIKLGTLGIHQGDLMKDAIRNILIHTVGILNSYYDHKEEKTPIEEVGAIDMSLLNDNKPPYMIEVYEEDSEDTNVFYVWSKKVEPPERKRKYYHPEWATTIWGRARTRITAFTLTIPYDDIIGIRTDCVWSASNSDRVQGEKQLYRAGEFREKDRIKGPCPRPQSKELFLNLIDDRIKEARNKKRKVQS